MDEAGTSTANVAATESELAAAEDMFKRGIECVNSNKLEAAVQLFADVLQTRTRHYGELALECASAYYRYGSVLLYQAQENADVFGAPLHEENNEENGFDKENEEADTTRKGKDEMDKGKGPKPREEDEPAEHHANADDDQEGQEVDGGDLQLAWENLETARAIWSRTDPEVYAQELSDVNMLLGDVSMENEEFEVALGEFDEALKHLKNVTGILPSDRRWAEVHFKRCYALQYMNRNAEALGAVKDAMEVLELRKSSLNLEKDALEVADVNAVLEDLKEKVEELEVAVKEEQAMKESMKSMLEQMKSAGGGGAGAEGGGQAAKGGATTPVKDLGVVGRGTKRINLAPVAVGEQENQVMEKKSRSFPVNIEKAPAAEPANEREQLPTENGSGTAPMPAFLKALADKETKTDQNGQAP